MPFSTDFSIFQIGWVMTDSLPPFSFLLALRHTHVSIGRRHTDRLWKPANTTLTLCKVLLSPLALADAEAAASYQLTTCFVLEFSLRYSPHPRIAVEQPYFRTRVHNTFAGKMKYELDVSTFPCVSLGDAVVLVSFVPFEYLRTNTPLPSAATPTDFTGPVHPTVSRWCCHTPSTPGGL